MADSSGDPALVGRRLLLEKAGKIVIDPQGKTKICFLLQEEGALPFVRT